MGAGIAEAGGRVETIDLAGLDIKPCRACESCHRGGGGCVQKDGMQTIYPKLIAADILVLASPIYWFNLSAQIKIFLDRCFAVAAGENGAFAKKTIAAALVYGNPEPFVSGAINAIRCLQDTCAYTGAVWGGCVHASAGGREAVAGQPALLDQARDLGRRLAG
jgi:multimeric flavodoxin WrbA